MMGTSHERRGDGRRPAPGLRAAVLTSLGLVAGLAPAATVVGQNTWPPASSASASVYSRPAPPSGSSTPLPPAVLPPVEAFRLEERPDPAADGPAAAGYDHTGHDHAGHDHGLGGGRPTVPLGTPGPGGLTAGGPPISPSGAGRTSPFPPPGRPAGGPAANRFDPAPIGRPEDYARVAMTESPIPALPSAESAGLEVKTPLPRRGEADESALDAAGAKSPWASAGTTIVSLAAVIGLFLAVMLVQRRLRGAAPASRMPGEILEALGSIPAGPRAEYRLVRFADRVLLLHAQGTTVVTLSEVTDLDTVEHLVTICRQHQKDALPTGLRRLLTHGQAAASERRVRAIA